MPLLLKAVPLKRNWFGRYTWRTPSMLELPVELEYIPYAEFEARFRRLNQIAGPSFPTFWPNLGAILIMLGVVVAAAVGIARSGSNMSIMGQGACFVLPVIIVIWIKIRKETRARSIKRFKHQSQKLLRAWTAADIESHAMQWKLRLRTKAAARQRQQRYAHQVMVQTPPPATADMVIQPDPATNSLDPDNQQLQQQQSSSPPSPTLTSPSPSARIYQHLRVSTLRASSSPSEPTTQTPVVMAGGSGGMVPMIVPMTRGEEEDDWHRGLSFWQVVKDTIKEIPCCAYLCRERRVWMIEISLRECQLDEYALTVPSPVYCDYRLPPYDDIMNPSGPSTSPPTSRAMASTSRITLQQRYAGSPPAYESESDNESENADDDDDGEDNLRPSTATSRQNSSLRLPIIGSTQNQSGPLGTISGSTSASGSGSGSGQQQMTMVRRGPAELTSIIVMSSSSSCSTPSSPGSSSNPVQVPAPVRLSCGVTAAARRVLGMEDEAMSAHGTTSTTSLSLSSVDHDQDKDHDHEQNDGGSVSKSEQK